MRHLNRLLLALACLSLSSSLLASKPPSPLYDYLALPEPTFAWQKDGQAELDGVVVHDLTMTSQTWQGAPWRHGLHVFVPNADRHPGWAVLIIGGGSGPPSSDPSDAADRRMGASVAAALGTPAALLTRVPNQPLFGELVEDALIAYTFRRYLETGDAHWPLLLPMTKSVIKAMEVVQAFARQELQQEINHFVVTGASKRGWTAWLTAASGDPRVRGIIPMVYDSLNLAAQMPHQLALWGRYSEQIADYTATGLVQRMTTTEGRALTAIVDPYTYRSRLALPKLIVNGSNDPYWATDALSLYWDDLPGPKAVLYLPNCGHDLADWPRVLATCSAFLDTLAEGQRFPAIAWEQQERGDTLLLILRSSPLPQEGRLWIAHSPTHDFRCATWSEAPMRRRGRVFVGEVPKSETGSVALFGEAVYREGDRTFTLSTAPHIYPSPPGPRDASPSPR